MFWPPVESLDDRTIWDYTKELSAQAYPVADGGVPIERLNLPAEWGKPGSES